ncbi:lipocalin family protein [Hymenobacter tenuis]
MYRFHSLVSVFLLMLVTALSSCQKDTETPAPTSSVTAAQLVQKWQLDEVYINNQLSASGTNIKDRYTIQFRADGTYVQTMLADNTTYAGTWKLEEGTVVTLKLTDHKGDLQQYVVGAVSNQVLRYARVNSKAETEELRFTSLL